MGIGGSATNDAGIGMLRALGSGFSIGAVIPSRIAVLAYEQLESIDLAGLDTRTRGLRIEVAVDVDNPLCGSSGASRTFAAQKGASPEQVEELERVLQRFADVAERVLGRDYRNVPGAGAAGGLGFAFVAFLGGHLVPGVTLVACEVWPRRTPEGASYCMTGEGKIDPQTLHGKTVDGVAQMALQRGVSRDRVWR